MIDTWRSAQTWEQDWWGSCTNTLGEETKQLLYANRMGLKMFHDGKSPYNFDLAGASVLDIGGGPTSLLLRCVSIKGKVIDPLSVPDWVLDRYIAAGIAFAQSAGEDIVENGYDECWIYNVLQHVRDPARVIQNAQRASKLIRLFEWIDTPINEGHPHTLTRDMLDSWLGGEGKVERLDGQNTCWGMCYYGIFPTTTA